MAISFSFFQKLALALLGPIMNVLTPTLRKEMEKFLIDFYKRAKDTDNPWDDFLAEFLLRMMDIPIPE